MPTRIAIDTRTLNDAFPLGTGVNFLQPLGVTVVSINGNAVIGTGEHRFAVVGSLLAGKAGIRIDSGVNSRVTVAETGNIIGDLAGVQLFDSTRSVVVNSGTISSLSGSAVQLDRAAAALSGDPDARFVLRNFGTITGETGVTTGTGLATITNEGLIATTDDVAIRTGNLVDSLLNLGRIRGDIALGGGDDVLTNEGSIFGNVALGEDQNTLTNTGTVRGTVQGGTDNDTVDNDGRITAIALGEGVNTLTNTGSIVGTVSGGSNLDRIENNGGRSGALNLGDGNNSVLNLGGRIGSI